jgi:hypothetical protein
MSKLIDDWIMKLDAPRWRPDNADDVRAHVMGYCEKPPNAKF